MKDQLITEMRESCALLENQLRLMDEKYMELRSKLDWTRSQTERVVKKKENEGRVQRQKFSILLDQQILLYDFKGRRRGEEGGNRALSRRGDNLLL